jgi:hypothetical protein
MISRMESGVVRHYLDNKRPKDYQKHNNRKNGDTTKHPKLSLEQMVQECGLKLINGKVHS